ncbi:unnamed protein product [Effrenium voratum]|uniref:JmjC domain-containing protein n=1 Tax=Effrenium voratum TaxID=2562239 RepID=A0AA36JT22_9DINO|nr:unnamed protein product [Effrenium voratum]CAJ1415097.1 unnamed protein product [Effrenium voratum]
MAAKRSSALVRFVYARCGAKGGEACAALGARRPTNFSELRAAVQDSWPAILGSEGVLPSALLAPLPDLIQLADLCGHRQVAVRLPKARLSFLGVRSSFLEDPKERTFGDVRKGKAPYEDAELAVLKDVIQELTTSQAARRYAASVPLDRDLPELAALAEPLRSHWAKLLEVLGPEVPNTPVMYLGSGEQRTPLHCDPTENITIVVQGSKLFRLFPPAAAPYLRPLGGWLPAAACWLSGVVPAVYSAADAFQPLPGPKPLDVQLQAGQGLYLPAGWWHAVVGSQEPNMAIVFGYAPHESKGARYFQSWLHPFLGKMAS